MARLFSTSLVAIGLLAAFAVFARAPHGAFSIEQVTSYPYPVQLVASRNGDRLAWIIDQRGVRNIWVADGPGFKPRQVSHYSDDDGQELSQLAFTADNKFLVYVRGGDHDANWPAEGNLAPDPTSSPIEPKVTIWSIALDGGKIAKVAEGDEPAISSQGQLAFIKDHQVWKSALDGSGKPERLFFDRGKDGDLRWSPDGSRLAFVSDRGDHAFIGIYRDQKTPIEYLAPSTGRDSSPRWSPHGKRIAFVRQPGDGGPPRPILKLIPHPWAIWVANVATGDGHMTWQSPDTLRGSYPQTEGETNLHWADGNRLTFLSDIDNWPHLYSVPADGGEATLLTPGKFMVEFVSMSPNRHYLVYSANTGATPGDDDRRHLYRVPVDAAKPVALTSGTTIEWQPVITGDNRHVAYITAGARRPPLIAVASATGADSRLLNEQQLPSDYPTAQLVAPKPVEFKAADGWTIHGQLFEKGTGGSDKPGIIFVHGGPPRQMFLGWHNFDYYSNSYAVNQYLADHGFIVLSVNYRLGIGYGHDFHHPEHWGPTGASEYQDVVAGAKYLQQLKGVDSKHIGIWGGSYGGYLTALALARNSDIFKAGVDMHGVHDWSPFIGEWFGQARPRYEQGDRKEAMKVAFESSPDADIAKWKSPVLVIQGDDDRNVHFHQSVDLVQRLRAHDIPFSEIVIPNEIHGFLRYASWLRADSATVEYFKQQFHTRE